MKLTINVTQDDINNGCRFGACTCPIARAATREILALGLPIFDKEPCSVGPDTLTVYNIDSQTIRFDLPEVAQEFIRKFDGRVRNLAPFSFELPNHYIFDEK